MDFDKLIYKRTSSDKSEKEPKARFSDQFADDRHFLSGAAGSAEYQKVEGVLPTNIILVISGGEKKEKDFLKELVDQRRSHFIRVLFVSEAGQGLQPYQMREKWLQFHKAGYFMVNGQTYRLSAMDKIFLLSDLDEYWDQLIKILQIPCVDSEQWIISNPCFEIWLYYCYRNAPEVDLVELKALQPKDRSNKLKTLENTLLSGGVNPGRAFEKMMSGIEHSKEHYSVDADNIPVLYATQMHIMAQYIVDTMNSNDNEYTNLVARKEKERLKLKRKLKGEQ